METKRTEELRKSKTSIKARLMSAIAMLLVSTIMLSSTTYAWFVLSTAPEVTGMSTTVGSNGSLEIALLNDSYDTTAIQSGVGDSSAASTQTVAGSNITWGNIVDLSGASYGLQGVKLYPAALNLADDDTLVNGYSSLKFPTYGTDGRVASLVADTTSGRYVEGAFRAKREHFGVRAIGQAAQADPVAAAFAESKDMFNFYTNQAKAAAKGSLDAYGTKLIDIVVKHAADDTATHTQDEVNQILGAKTGLQLAHDHLATAIRYAYQAWYVSENEKLIPGELEQVQLTTIAGANDGFAAFVAQLNALNTKIGEVAVTQKTAAEGQTVSYTWDEIKTPLNKLIDTDGMTIAGYTISEISRITGLSTSDPEYTAMISALMGAPDIIVKSGLYSDTANFVDKYNSVPFDMSVNGIKSTNAEIYAYKADGVDTAYCTVVTGTLGTLEAPSGEADNLITSTYGYIIDLAFRSSTGTTLQLSDATQRVSGDADTDGDGSTFTVTDGERADLDALRVVFIEHDPDSTSWNILGVATPEATATTENGTTYKLVMRDWTVAGNGGIDVAGGMKTKGVTDPSGNPVYVVAPEGTDASSKDADGYLLVDGQKVQQTEYDPSITTLTAGEGKCISVLVYLDGNFVDSSLDSASGMLNLQFGSSATLTPMDYSGYVTSYSTTVSWSNVAEADRPDHVTAALYADGKDTGKTATLTASENWTYKFGSLDIYNADGKEIVYTVVVTATDYTASTDTGNGNITLSPKS